MANDFSGDANCVALWRMESGALTTDSKGTNTLTDNNTVQEDAVDFKEGACSADFEVSNGESLTISDADLDAGFPFKNGGASTKFSICLWVKFESTSSGIFGKGTTVGTDATIALAFSAGSLIRLLIGYNNGNTYETIAFGTAGAVNKWYHIGITYDSDDKSYRIRVWDAAAEPPALLGADATGTSTNAINIEAGQFSLAGVCASGYSGGDERLDEVVVFKDILTADEIDQIRAGTYGAAGGAPADDGSALRRRIQYHRRNR